MAPGEAVEHPLHPSCLDIPAQPVKILLTPADTVMIIIQFAEAFTHCHRNKGHVPLLQSIQKLTGKRILSGKDKREGHAALSLLPVT
ncbi:hypothetical protein D3C74_403900 [compost metagenome]